MRPQGQTKLGFFPLPVAEAKRLKNWIALPDRFSAVDPCVGDGVAFATLIGDTPAHRYGIEIDSNRSEQSRALGIETFHANAMDVRCQAESISLLYLNPPYDWEYGEANNQRLEFVFLEHTYRWLKPGGVLIFVIPQLRLAKCARLLAEQFTDVGVFHLTEPECVQYKQVVLLATRRKRNARLSDAALIGNTRFLESLATQAGIAPLTDSVEIKYQMPGSGPAVLTNVGISLDEVEDLLLDSAAYRQAARVSSAQTGTCERPSAYAFAWRSRRTALHRGHA